MPTYVFPSSKRVAMGRDSIFRAFPAVKGPLESGYAGKERLNHGGDSESWREWRVRHCRAVMNVHPIEITTVVELGGAVRTEREHPIMDVAWRRDRR